MASILAFWLCGLCIVALYHSIPERGTRQDIYDATLGILSACVIMVSAAIIVVSLLSPTGLHPGKWM
jgi:hypothetical protein